MTHTPDDGDRPDRTDDVTTEPDAATTERDAATAEPDDAPMPTVEAVETALGGVADPDLGGSVLDAGVVDDVDVADGAVTVEATFAGLDDETADVLAERMRTAVMERPGVGRVRVETGESADVDRGLALDGVDRVVAVASAKGGVGKTTVATQLARGLAATGERVGLFDADVYGPNVPDLLDVDGPLETTDDGAAKPVETGGLQVVSVGLIANDEPLAWRGAMANEAVEELLADAAWDVDTLVVDLPPGTGDVVLTALQSFPVDGTVLVTTPFPTAAADTRRSATLFREEGVSLLGTVVNMAGFTCPSCGDDHAPFGRDPSLDTEVLAELPIDDELRSTGGAVPERIRDLAGTVREELAEAESLTVPEHALDLRGVPERARVEQARAEFAALAPGESLFVVSDRQPASIRSAVADAADCDPDVTTARQSTDSWVVRFGKHDGECRCATAAAE